MTRHDTLNLLKELADKTARENNYKDSVIYYKGLLCYETGMFAILYNIGIMSFKSNDFHNAEKWFRRAAHASPLSVVAWQGLAQALSQGGAVGRFLVIRKILQAVIALEPDQHPHMADYGLQCLCTARQEEAILAFRRALILGNDDATTHVYLSECLALANQLPEAEHHLATALRLNPDLAASEAGRDLRELQTLPSSRRPPVSRSRYPTAADITADLRKVVVRSVLGKRDKYPALIGPTTRFITMGSCFAGNIAKNLKQRGWPVANVAIGEHVNSTYANRSFLDWIDGRLTGPVADRMEELVSGLQRNRDEIRNDIINADIFILTLGVAPGFFERDGGAFVMPRATQISNTSLAGLYEFRTTSVAENIENVKYCIDLIRRLNPEISVILTVSPVPLDTTFEFDSAVVADCLSKSVLRVAADELMRAGIANLHYWPSFEIVRWLGAHTGPVFGVDDGFASHVSQELIDMIIDLFVEVFREQG